MDAKPDTHSTETPTPEIPDRGESLRRQAEANAAHLVELARHLRTFSQKAGVERGEEHWTPALPFEAKPD
ncbi:MAG: hypothetical protein JF588_13115 [Caulobacterales bacterium]|nr:hypothetical protein [Caulobacterales bacterium]